MLSTDVALDVRDDNCGIRHDGICSNCIIKIERDERKTLKETDNAGNEQVDTRWLTLLTLLRFLPHLPAIFQFLQRISAVCKPNCSSFWGCHMVPGAPSRSFLITIQVHGRLWFLVIYWQILFLRPLHRRHGYTSHSLFQWALAYFSSNLLDCSVKIIRSTSILLIASSVSYLSCRWLTALPKRKDVVPSFRRICSFEWRWKRWFGTAVVWWFLNEYETQKGCSKLYIILVTCQFIGA